MSINRNVIGEQRWFFSDTHCNRCCNLIARDSRCPKRVLTKPALNGFAKQKTKEQKKKNWKKIKKERKKESKTNDRRKENSEKQRPTRTNVVNIKIPALRNTRLDKRIFKRKKKVID